MIDFSKWGRATAPLSNASDDLSPWLLDIWGTDDPPVPFLFQYRNCGFIARNNLQIVKGREKSGKSAFGVLLVAAALGGQFLGVSTQNGDRLRVLWIDTEQDRSVLRKRARKAAEMAQYANGGDRLAVAPLKGDLPAERLKKALSLMRWCRPDFVFLDGLADLCEDFNDNKECAALVSKLITTAEEVGCAILAVIHTNKRDDEARGHLGSLAQQKASEVYLVEKKAGSDTPTVSQDMTRFAGVPDMGFKFGDDFALLPAYGGLTKAEVRRQELQNAFAELLAGGKSRSFCELRGDYAAQAGCSQRCAQSAIMEAKNSGILTVDKQGRTKLYRLAVSVDFEGMNGGENEGNVAGRICEQRVHPYI